MQSIIQKIFVIVFVLVLAASSAYAELKLESVDLTLGELGKDFEVKLTGTGFDQNTRVSVYPDTGSRRSIISSLDTSGDTNDVAVAGDIAYIADGNGGLQVIDISIPSQPKIISSLATRGFAEELAVAGNIALVACSGDWNGLQVIDIKTPSQLKVIGSIDTPSGARGVAVTGNTAFVACTDSEQWNGLQIIDISNPSQPIITGSANTSGWAKGVAAAGNTVFLADDWNGLQIIDATTPSHPVIIGSAETPGRAFGVTVADTTVFVADAYGGLQIIDVSTPSLPVIIGYADTTGWAEGVTVTESIALVADDENGLLAIDIGIPSSPVIIGSVNTPGNAEKIAFTGNIALVADGESGLQLIDRSAISLPVIIGSADTPGFARGLAVAGNTAFVADYDKGLQVIDISTPSHPVIIGSFDTPGDAEGVWVAGTTAFVADGDKGLQIIDIGTPSSPVIIGSIDTPGRAFGVTVAGTTAFVADGDKGLQIIDIGTPSNPVIIGSVDTPGKAFGVTVTGTAVFVADGENGLQVVDISTPIQPLIIGSLDTLGNAFGVTVSGTLAFVADGEGGLQVVDISTPSRPVIAGSAEILGDASGITFAGSTVFVTEREGGLQVIDITTSSQPIIIGSVYIPGYAEKVVIADDTIYVAAGRAGLITLPMKAVTEISPVTVNSETEITVNFSSPTTAGHWTLKVFNENEYDELISAVTFVESDSEALTAKAVIVAARVGYSEGLWKNTLSVADDAYEKLGGLGYDADRIYYLTSESDLENAADALPTRENLSYAVKEWSKNASGLLLYFVGHGDTETFRISDDEEITAAELNSWLNDLDLDEPGYTVFVYDACRSGTFIPSLRSSGKKRIVIASAFEDAEFSDWGYTSFSSKFWQALSSDANLNDSFLKASAQMKAHQTALLDADGSGIPNEPEDKDEAGKIVIGRGRIVNQERSTIAEISADQTLSGETSADIWAAGLSFEKADITGVYAEIIPPDRSDASAEFSRIELADPDNDGKYEGTYNNFTVTGTYTVNMYAEPKETRDTVSYPRQMTVTQTKGEDRSEPDSYEDDDTPGQAKVIHVYAAPQMHNFHEPGDKADWIKFYATADQHYTLRAGSVSVICDVILELYDADGSKLDEQNGRTRGGDESFDWKCPKDGVYFVKAANANPNIFGENTRYNLEIYRPKLPADFVWLQGKISSPSGAAVESVRIKTEYEGALTDENGEYRLFHSPGDYTLTAEIGGYTRFETPVSLPCEAQNITMKEAENVIKGDTSGNGAVDLTDALLSLHAAVGSPQSDMVYKQADVNNDQRIGLAELIYILKRLAR